MTLDGTNTYLLGSPGSGGVVVVDPGPDVAEHRAAIEAAAAAEDAAVAAVVFTHHHIDHAQAARWAREWGVQAFAFSPEMIRAAVSPLADGAMVAVGGVTVEAVHTPGHASDHLCLRVAQTGAVLTGDHVLGRGTTVVAWPDGDMAAYMDSLHRLARLDATVLYPGHGPPLPDPAAVVRQYIAHREEREEQVVAALTAGDDTPRAVVKRVYADVDEALHPAAERSVRAHLDKLIREERVGRVLDPSSERESYRVR
ncbi:MAG: MBL fold metallo-hydrolase [Nitriliruptorales bacterium]|nr:MBL fold metallo-hydrolase [Nitriliruptorales bacterium]